jgi:uncharacterized protein (DUF4415 family)
MPTAKTTKPAKGRTDWDGLRALPEAEIERLAEEDEENPATKSDDEWAHGVVGLPPRKRSIHASFDSDVVDFFKSEGRGYQTRMNAVLRRYMEVQRGKGAGR